MSGCDPIDPPSAPLRSDFSDFEFIFVQSQEESKLAHCTFANQFPQTRSDVQLALLRPGPCDESNPYAQSDHQRNSGVNGNAHRVRLTGLSVERGIALSTDHMRQHFRTKHASPPGKSGDPRIARSA